MTFSCIGIGITQKIAVGFGHVLQRRKLETAPRFIEPSQVPDEVDRFRLAVSEAVRSLRKIRQRVAESARSDILAFIDTHLLMLDDSALIEVPVEHIRARQCAAEWALQLQREALAEVFSEFDDPYLRTRMDDVDHLVNHIQKILQQQEEPNQDDPRGRIAIAQDLSPAELIVLHHQGIAGFVTESGGPMSHTAILARSLGIPAVVGVRNATQGLHQGEQLIVDGRQGVLLATSDNAIMAHYRQLIEESRKHTLSLRGLIGQATVTQDGARITLMANIELPEDLAATRSLDADGVGLYRTEYLFMNRPKPPDEEEQFATYRQVVEKLEGIPITIRTLDLGADKPAGTDNQNDRGCSNPALGLRAIRLCLKIPQLFRPQLRAILRTSALGPVKIMIPMISTLQEVRQLKAMVEEAKRSLLRDGLAFDPGVEIGGMIEVPAAALAADAFARELDFLSIGTNDLIQYTLAIDRIDDEVNYLYDPLHPAVLRLIKMVIDAGQTRGIPVGMCGEMAADPRYIPLLVGLGLRQFSVQPGSLLEAKWVLRSIAAQPLMEQVSRLMPQIAEQDTVETLMDLCNPPRFHH
ncbi:MAG: phosphoenolpyruvate--protein phosphotransferase [Gammaproteobacteria bacterium]|nr:phosphoenolpyruvate--protein phosphotransferase [Gammaproteobacteria bacterium]